MSNVLKRRFEDLKGAIQGIDIEKVSEEELLDFVTKNKKLKMELFVMSIATEVVGMRHKYSEMSEIVHSLYRSIEKSRNTFVSHEENFVHPDFKGMITHNKETKRIKIHSRPGDFNANINIIGELTARNITENTLYALQGYQHDNEVIISSISDENGSIDTDECSFLFDMKKFESWAKLESHKVDEKGGFRVMMKLDRYHM